MDFRSCSLTIHSKQLNKVIMKNLLIIASILGSAHLSISQTQLEIVGQDDSVSAVVITSGYQGSKFSTTMMVEAVGLKETAASFEGGLVGVSGISPVGVGVLGSSVSSMGVRGFSEDHWGVNGQSTNSFGVIGHRTMDYGLRGESVNSSGVYGDANSTSQYDFIAWTADGSKGYGTSSSRRWKKNITRIPNALKKVSQLRGVFYDWKQSGRHDMGFIAEEVGEVIPEVVSYEENGRDAIGVDYGRITPLLVEAIKAMDEKYAARLMSLEAKVEELRRELSMDVHTERWDRN